MEPIPVRHGVGVLVHNGNGARGEAVNEYRDALALRDRLFPGAGGPLVVTKVVPPVPASPHVDRPGVVEALDRAIGRPITQIVAPAGFGKTSALVQWVSGQPPGFASWLTLSGIDAGQFVPYLIWSVAMADPEAAKEGARQFRQGATPSVVLAGLVAGVWRLGREVVTVFDDLHATDDPAVYGLIDRLVESLPGNWRLILASRTPPSLAMAKRRASLELSEVGAAELALAPAEVQEILTQVYGVDLDFSDAETVCRYTGGWPAGVSFAGLAARHSSQDGLDNSHRDIDQFLTTEILPDLPASHFALLRRTSLLAELSPELCDELLGRADSAVILEDLLDRRLFIEQLSPGLCRTTDLFAGYLRRWFGSESTGEASQLCTAAGRSYEAQGRLVDALRCALAAEEWAMACRLLTGCGYRLLQQGRSGAVLEWMKRIPPEVSLAHPQSLLIGADAANAQGDFALASEYVARVERVTGYSQPDDARSLIAGTTALRCYEAFRTGRLRRAAVLVASLDSYGTDEVQRQLRIESIGSDSARQLTLAAHYYYATGGLVQMRRVLTSAAAAPPSALAAVPRLGYQSLLEFHDGSASAAAELARGAIRLERDRTEPSAGSVVPWMVLGWAGTDEEAVQAAQIVDGLAVRLGTPGIEICAMLLRAEVAARAGMSAEARDALERACTIVAILQDPSPYPMWEAIQRGRVDAAYSRVDAARITEREKDVLQLLARGLDRKEIARELAISHNTVSTHRRNAFRKLAASDRDDALKRAITHGLIDPAK